ncbi:MAG: zinc-ribbon domain-containing protein [Ruminococcus sp.]
MPDINFDDLSKTISSAAETFGRKTESFLEMQKMKSQIHSARRAVEKSFRDLGELIYHRYDAGEGVDSEVEVICEDISQMKAVISEMKEELALKKGRKICPVCQAEVAAESVYCMKCGSKIMTEEEEADVDVDDVAEDNPAEEILAEPDEKEKEVQREE